jgi:hypothetical protein
VRNKIADYSIPHIAPVEEEITGKLSDEIEKELK